MTLSRLLAWEVMAAHGLTGALFAAIQLILLAHARLEHWWIVALVLPVAVFSWLGWAYEGWIIWRGTAELRNGKGEMRDGK